MNLVSPNARLNWDPLVVEADNLVTVGVCSRGEGKMFKHCWLVNQERASNLRPFLDSQILCHREIPGLNILIKRRINWCFDVYYLHIRAKECIRRTRDEIPEDAVFAKAFIAHKLDHVKHFERDAQLLKEGAQTNNPYETMLSKIQVCRSWMWVRDFFFWILMVQRIGSTEYNNFPRACSRLTAG